MFADLTFSLESEKAVSLFISDCYAGSWQTNHDELTGVDKAYCRQTVGKYNTRDPNKAATGEQQVQRHDHGKVLLCKKGCIVS